VLSSRPAYLGPGLAGRFVLKRTPSGCPRPNPWCRSFSSGTRFRGVAAVKSLGKKGVGIRHRAFRLDRVRAHCPSAAVLRRQRACMAAPCSSSTLRFKKRLVAQAPRAWRAACHAKRLGAVLILPRPSSFLLLFAGPIPQMSPTGDAAVSKANRANRQIGHIQNASKDWVLSRPMFISSALCEGLVACKFRTETAPPNAGAQHIPGGMVLCIGSRRVL